jgi:hypothetical protein
MCDDNSINYSDLYSSIYKNIRFLQIENNICESSGFINSNTALGSTNNTNYTSWSELKTISWDKAYYYFSTVNTSFDNVWLIEDDCFFYNEMVLTELDFIYLRSDLITSQCMQLSIRDMRGTRSTFPRVVRTNDNDDFFELNRPLYLSEPFYLSMQCACRLSKRVFEEIVKYINKSKSLFFFEVCIPTLVKQANLKYDCPLELKYINAPKSRIPWNDTDINSTHIFHPVKDLNKHLEYRAIMNAKN